MDMTVRVEAHRGSMPQDPNADKYQPRPDIVIQERNETTIID